MLTFLKSLSRVLVVISSMSVPICNHFHAMQANPQNNVSLAITCMTYGKKLGVLTFIILSLKYLPAIEKKVLILA